MTAREEDLARVRGQVRARVKDATMRQAYVEALKSARAAALTAWQSAAADRSAPASDRRMLAELMDALQYLVTMREADTNADK